MVKHIKIIDHSDYTITLWETGTISVSTSTPLNSYELIKTIRENQCIVPTSFESFIDIVNTRIVADTHQSFLFNTEQNSTDYIEYLSNDALVRIYKDEMKVELLLSPEATYGNIMVCLNTLNIKYGINESLIRENIEKKETHLFIIAKGSVPTPYQPRKYTCDFLTERTKPLQMKQKGRVVFLDLSIQNRVVKDSKIATFTESIPSMNGKTVTGHTLPISSKEQETLILGANTYEEENSVYSAISGMIAFNDDPISVIPTHLLSRATINQTIVFDGTVILDNKVTNCTIKATGDVIVCGDASDTIIEAGGFVYLLIGISGKQSRIEAAYDIFTPFVYHGNLKSSDGNIFIAYEAMQSNIQAAGPIVIEGKVAGGRVESGHSIKIHTAGSERSSAPTHLSIKTSNQKEIQYKELLHVYSIYKQQARDMYLQIKRYEIRNAHRKNEFKQDEKYLKMKQIESIISGEASKLNNQLNSLKTFIKDTQSHKILVYGNVWNGVTIKINNFDLEIKETSYASFFEQGNHGIIRTKYA